MRVASGRGTGAPNVEWDHVDWAIREDGRTNLAVDELKAKYPATAADPDNWRFDIVCGRDGVAQVRLMKRRTPAPPRPPRKKPRRG
jgi:hypothetical protein